MENNNEEALFRGRSSRSCVRMGCRLYLSNFRRILKSSWIPALLFAVCNSVVGTIAVIQYPRLNLNAFVHPQQMPALFDDYLAIFTVSALAFLIGGLMEVATYSCSFRLLDRHRETSTIPQPTSFFSFSRQWAWRSLKGFLSTALTAVVITVIVSLFYYALLTVINKVGGKVLIPLSLTWIPTVLTLIGLLPPLLYMNTKYILDTKVKFWSSAVSSYMVGLRHCGQLIVVLLMAFVIVIIVSSILSFPAIVVATANFQANIGLLYGDPLGMPSYIIPLTAVVMAFAGFVEVMTRLVVFYTGYYAYGSIEVQEEEKKKFNKDIQDTL